MAIKALTILFITWHSFTAIAQGTLANASSAAVQYNKATTGLYAANETERRTYMARLFKSLPKAQRYSYKEFVTGHFVDLDGEKSPEYLINYNKFLSAVEHVNEEGDTVALTDFHPARYVITPVDTIIHVPGEGFFRIDHANNERVRLVSKEVVLVVSQHEVDDQTAQPGAPSKKEQFTALYTPRDPDLRKEQVLLALRKTYFLVDDYHRVYDVSSRGFIQAFRKNRSIVENNINARIRQHRPVHFYNDAEVMAFLDFCNRLEKMDLH